MASKSLLFAMGFVTCVISLWVSNTATTAMMLPIGLGIVYAVADMLAAKSGRPVDPTRLRYGTGMMLMAAYAASAGGIATPAAVSAAFAMGAAYVVTGSINQSCVEAA